MSIIQEFQKDQIASHLEVLRHNLSVAKDKFPEMYRGKIGMWEYEILLHELALKSFEASGGVLSDVAAERRRQKDEEGWSTEHDDEHPAGQLAIAASCYASCPWDPAHRSYFNPPANWPWEPQWWKPKKDPRRNLIRAAALIVAEIERMDRAVSSERN